MGSRHMLGYDLRKNKFINCHSNLMLLPLTSQLAGGAPSSLLFMSSRLQVLSPLPVVPKPPH